MENFKFLTKEQIATIKEPIPPNLVFTDPGGNKYVNHNVITEILNKVFNYAWKWEIIDKGIETTQSFTNKKGELLPEQHYAWVLGRLSYPVKDPVTGSVIWCYKEQFGGKTIVGNGKVQSQVFKSASSDALKKAASLIGLAPNVYMSDDVLEALEESDSDSWTEDKISIFSEEVAKMSSIKAEIGEAEFINVIRHFCEDTEDYTQEGVITPSNIKHFLEWYNNQNKNTQPEKSAPKFKIL